MNEMFEEVLEYLSASHIFRPPPKDVACIAPIQRKYNKMIRSGGPRKGPGQGTRRLCAGVCVYVSAGAEAPVLGLWRVRLSR